MDTPNLHIFDSQVSGGFSASDQAKYWGVSTATIRRWRRFRKQGTLGEIAHRKRGVIDDDLFLEDYLDGISAKEQAEKVGISIASVYTRRCRLIAQANVDRFLSDSDIEVFTSDYKTLNESDLRDKWDLPLGVIRKLSIELVGRPPRRALTATEYETFIDQVRNNWSVEEQARFWGFPPARVRDRRKYLKSKKRVHFEEGEVDFEKWSQTSLSSWSDLPNTPGLYSLWDAESLLYIGSSSNLGTRFRNGHHAIMRVLAAYPEKAPNDFQIRWMETPDLDLEKYLIRKHKPVFNIRSS